MDIDLGRGANYGPIAAMLVDGRVGVDTYTPARIAHPQTLDLALLQDLAGRLGKPLA